MAISFTNIGGNTSGGSSVSTLAISVPAGGVPQGAGVTVIVQNGSGISSCTDTGSNTYAATINVTAGALIMAMFTSVLGTALVSGNSITAHVTSDTTCMTACYCTGVSALDSGITAHASNTSSTPTVTSGTPSTASSGLIGGLIWSSSSITFTQASGYISTLTGETAASFQINGGTKIISSASPTAFSPTLSGSIPWLIGIVGFKGAAAASTTVPLRARRGFGL